MDAVKKSLSGNSKGGFGVMRAEDDLGKKRKFGGKPPKPQKPPAPLSPPSPPPSQPQLAQQPKQPKATSAEKKASKAADKPKMEPKKEELPEQAVTLSGKATGVKRSRRLMKAAGDHAREALTSLGNKFLRRK